MLSSWRNLVLTLGAASAVFPVFCLSAAAESWKLEPTQTNVQQVTLPVQAQAPARVVPASIAFVCYPQKSVGLHFEAEFDQALTDQDFPFEDFEGPDAVFGTKELAAMRFRSANETVLLSSGGSGSYTELNRFRVSISLSGLKKDKNEAIQRILKDGLTSVELQLHQLKSPNERLIIKAEGPWPQDQLKRVVEGCGK